jgi:hypothetical protein
VSPRIGTLDIETFPYECYTWGIWEQNVGLEQIKTEWSIASYCFKWYGEKELIYADTGGRGRSKVRQDRKLLTGLHALLDEADIVIAQNGKKFDIKKINARMLMADLEPYSPIRIVDTMLEAKRIAAFTSNKLAWLSEYLSDTKKSEHRAFPGFELWTECLADNPKAWAEMKKYNCRDVVATEKVYDRLQPWIPNHPNVGTYAQTVGAVCVGCGSGSLTRRGDAVTQQGRYARMQCRDCGKWNRGKENIVPLANRKRLLANVL